MKKCIFEAHRGVSSDYPENTLAAFCAAVKLGYGMIELDTKFTADNCCVILHDKTVNRTARRPNGSKLETETPVSSLTLAEARELDFGLWFRERFRNEKIPTLEDALSFALEAKISLKFDNVMFSHTEAQLEIMLDTIDRMDALGYVGFTAGSVKCVKKTLARFPTAQIHYDGEVNDDTLHELSGLVGSERLTIWLRFANNRTSWCKVPPVTHELAVKVYEIGRLGLWLLDKPEELIAAIGDFGADIIETDGTLKPQ